MNRTHAIETVLGSSRSDVVPFPIDIEPCYYYCEPMTITSLMDDFCPSRYFQGEHGLSLYIETARARLLFDSGQTGAFLHNADHLGIDLARLDAVILSHGHYDHGGGLRELFEGLEENFPPLFAGRGFSSRRFSLDGPVENDIGLPLHFLPEGASSAIEIDIKTEIAPGVFILPRAERIHDSWIDPRFVRAEGDSRRSDLFDDELSLALTSESGLVVVAGCAHRGIVNIVESARHAFPGVPIRAVVGGFHLASNADEELASVVSSLAALEPRSVHCAHCTGLRGFSALASAMGSRVSWLHCGAAVRL